MPSPDFLLIVVCLLCCLHVLSLLFAYCAATQKPHSVRNKLKHGVSLVRPLCGLEPFSQQTLASSFAQIYDGPWEIIFCVAQPDDPILPLITALCAAHPQCHSRVLIGEDIISQNPKLNNIIKGWRAALYDDVIFTDSNLLLGPDYIARVSATFSSQAPCVSAPPIGSQPKGFWGEVECAMLNSHAARWQYAAAFCGVDFAQGKTLAFRRSSLRGDVMAAMALEPAEDAATTKYIRAMGARVQLLSQPYEQPIGTRRFAAFWGRHSRWARLRRTTFPALFALEIITGPYAPLLCLGAALGPWHPHILGAVLLILGLWYGAEALFVYALRWPLSALSPLAWLVRDGLVPAFYVAAWAKADFTWHGHLMTSAKQDIKQNIKQDIKQEMEQDIVPAPLR
jgi:ceramide glucosyltransferase